MWRKSRKLAEISEPHIQKECNKRDERGFDVLSSRYSIVKSFEKFFGFELNNFSSFEKLTTFLYKPTDPACLGVVRALFGLCMVLDVVEERGFADIDIRWGNPLECRFPLIHGMKAPSLPWIILIYTVMWIGAFGIMLGLHFKIACGCFVVPYWYIFLLDKSNWNNHTYLYGIVATLLWGTEANKYFALDARQMKERNNTVPLWNYFILKFQFFTLYFIAGLKKSDPEWLSGYAMTNLSNHWVFNPFKLFLTTEQTDFFIVHWFGFFFDLTVGFWMLLEKTRIPAMVFCTLFHLMNSRLFNIGMFPYVCLVTMPLFCNTDWPRKIIFHFKRNCSRPCFIKNQDTEDYVPSISRCEDIPGDKSTFNETTSCNEINNKIDNETSIGERNKEHTRKSSMSKARNVIANKDKSQKPTKATKKQKFIVSLLLFHVFLQLFLPYSHFITKGYNNWVPGLYGYSWDMMVHAWDIILVVIKVQDNVSKEERYLDPNAWVQTDRWEKHGDMVRQYAFCLKDNLIVKENHIFNTDLQHEKKPKWTRLSTNLSIYIDVWCSLNARFQQRMFDPNVDLLTVDWHPFKPVSFLMPLLSQYNSYRYKLDEIQQHVHTWSNDTDVLFVADFPGMHLDNYISKSFTNVTLTVLEGEVTYSEEDQTKGVIVSKDSSIPIKTGKFHKVKTTSVYPACYMYTYTNQNEEELETEGAVEPEATREEHPIMQEISYKINAWLRAFNHIANAFFI